MKFIYIIIISVVLLSCNKKENTNPPQQPQQQPVNIAGTWNIDTTYVEVYKNDTLFSSFYGNYTSPNTINFQSDFTAILTDIYPYDTTTYQQYNTNEIFMDISDDNMLDSCKITVITADKKIEIKGTTHKDQNGTDVTKVVETMRLFRN